jgi:hypothetical protein
MGSGFSDSTYGDNSVLLLIAYFAFAPSPSLRRVAFTKYFLLNCFDLCQSKTEVRYDRKQ